MTLKERLQKLAEIIGQATEHHTAYEQDLAQAEADAARHDDLAAEVAKLDALKKSLSEEVQALEARRTKAAEDLAALKSRL